MRFKLTFTGIDEYVNFDDIYSLSKEYPYIEWGILYSISRAGNDPRYPSYDFIKKFIEWAKCEISNNISLHLCGDAAKKYILLDDINDPELIKINILVKSFNRIQLNIHALQFKAPAALWGYIAPDADKPIIIQYNDNNYHFVQDLVTHRKNIHVLKDASGGRGEFNTDFEIPTMCSNVPIGFAGGIGPENIDNAAPKIYDSVMSQNVEGNYENKMFWLDMESKIRKDDFLNLQKMCTVASKIDKLYFNSYRNLEI